MNRLLQGDVGSGKTIVALQAAVIAIENGCQAALMAPTEILAVQHYLSARRILEHAGYRVELLISGMKSTEKAAALERIRTGEAQLAVGTHALIEDNVRVRATRIRGHRRTAPLRRAATQALDGQGRVTWPRTARAGADRDADSAHAFTDALRRPRRFDSRRAASGPHADRNASDQRAAPQRRLGRRAPRSRGRASGYIVYPVIEESKLELKAAMEEYERLSREVFPKFKLGLLHGRLSSEEKDDVMQRFRKNEVQILVATTVVEVGVDVPNATVMVIEHAERFGLSQLHQLRGRIGRGAAKSHCVLVGPVRMTDEARARLETMVRTCNGFEIAETDLNLRGPGEFFGTRQSGALGFHVANPLRDREVLELARREAFTIAEDSAKGRRRLTASFATFQANGSAAIIWHASADIAVP